MALFGSTATKDSLYEYTVKDAGEHIIQCAASRTLQIPPFLRLPSNLPIAHLVVSSMTVSSLCCALQVLKYCLCRWEGCEPCSVQGERGKAIWVLNAFVMPLSNHEEYSNFTVSVAVFAQGKVILVVNVASQCGFTPQYKELAELDNKYKSKGLVILGFPCNQVSGSFNILSITQTFAGGIIQSSC